VHGWADAKRAAFAVSTLQSTLQAPLRGVEGRFGARIEEWVRGKLPDRVVVSDLAAALSVSDATLRRHAHSELGLSVQAYARWVRLIIALEHVATGRSITDAATAAGFADGSHATRACREMFGLTPSDAIEHLTITRA
jgi:methylphosphotriester-DNA--protein-cysteine methyltransferase